ncbi:MAG: hypothetical protein ABJN36_08980 [Cyclobacteriaceae bacterium]
MSKFLLFIITTIVAISAIGQTSNRQLEASEIDQLFTEELKKKLNIDFPIYRSYEYIDNIGTHYLILTEHPDANGEKSEHNDSIKAYSYRITDSGWQINWQLKDFILPNGNPNSREYSIWFWSKYLTLDDIDNDGNIEPIIVYGTSGMNGTGDGRIKILTYHNGTKRAIRHQNGILDFQRNTQVDELFYELPNSVQDAVIAIMNQITSSEHGIFPAGWNSAMRADKLYFDEN